MSFTTWRKNRYQDTIILIPWAGPRLSILFSTKPSSSTISICLTIANLKTNGLFSTIIRVNVRLAPMTSNGSMGSKEPDKQLFQGSFMIQMRDTPLRLLILQHTMEFWPFLSKKLTILLTTELTTTLISESISCLHLL